ncbi:MAG: chromosome segregation protein SMC [Halanaerobiales bacterium]|nr:chromosome segregation protein SMC [Halanaerobiales bacterium]
MYLKRVEVHGFKSFAEATKIHFEPSITAIVGPNGSGKSNIVDAIRWVLGEQSAKSLRGSKMEDIIFSGSDKRKQMEFAKIQLVLDNSDGHLPIEYSEVSIGRRVSRKGGSDYLLNNSVCRLKDIEELIMDTGIGKEAYSIIGQGKVETILSSKPTDRRVLFEEAAGIIKYKTKKNEAMKKFEGTELNLARVQDIVSELERQAEPLKKQAENARKHKEYSSELSELEESMLLTQSTFYDKELNTYIGDRDRLAKNLHEREELVNSFDAKVEQLQNELDQINELFNNKQNQYFELKASRESMENRLAMILEKQNSLINQQQRIQVEIKERESGNTRYDEEKVQNNTSLIDLSSLRKELNQSIDEDKQKMDELADEIQIDIEKIEILKSDLMEFLKQRSELNTQLNRYQDEEKLLNQKIEELIRSRTHKDRSLDEAITQLHTVEQELKKVNDELVSVKRDHNYLSKRQVEDQKDLHQLQDKYTSLREEFHRVKSRLKVLKDLENSLEGYYGGVKNVLRARNKLVGIVGVVAELLHVDQNKEKAIAAALGGGLQNIVVNTGKNAKEAIDYLKKTRGGRATFLPLDMVRGNRMTESLVLKKIDGYLGVAANFVKTDPHLTPVVNNLLGRIIIAKDMDAALKISRAGEQKLRIVTLDGDNINPGGAVSGGSSQSHNHNLLGRNREIDELSIQVNGLNEELLKLSQQGKNVKTQVEEQAQKLESWQSKIHQLELNRASLFKDQQQLQKDTTEQVDSLSNVDHEFEANHERLGSLDREIQRLQKELDFFSAENSQKEAELKALELKNNQLIEEKNIIQVERTEKRIKLASLDEQEKNYQARIEQIVLQREENIIKIQSLEDEWQELELNKLEYTDQIKAIEVDKIHIHHDEEKAREEVARLKQEEKDLSGAFRKEDTRARKFHRRVSELTKEVNQYEVKIAELTSKLEMTKEKLKEDHGIDLDHYIGDFEIVEDLEGVQKRIRSLKWRLRVLGAVNLAAEEEYETLTKRLTFLKEQLDDLNKAKESLLGMIAELDETIKERFTKTYDLVKVEFKEVFTKLFGGGSAELILSDPENLLETGIEINAQPPGKKLQKLSLMSGGEKALTALALIFAFLKVKPSPFYILDEIDAPLDEANVERFCNFLREFSSVSQFVIITHRSRTMAEADVLYGVTMEESGVSKLISYKFSEKVS